MIININPINVHFDTVVKIDILLDSFIDNSNIVVKTKLIKTDGSFLKNGDDTDFYLSSVIPLDVLIEGQLTAVKEKILQNYRLIEQV